MAFDGRGVGSNLEKPLASGDRTGSRNKHLDIELRATPFPGPVRGTDPALERRHALPVEPQPFHVVGQNRGYFVPVAQNATRFIRSGQVVEADQPFELANLFVTDVHDQPTTRTPR